MENLPKTDQRKIQDPESASMDQFMSTDQSRIETILDVAVSNIQLYFNRYYIANF